MATIYKQIKFKFSQSISKSLATPNVQPLFGLCYYYLQPIATIYRQIKFQIPISKSLFKKLLKIRILDNPFLVVVYVTKQDHWSKFHIRSFGGSG